MSAPFCNKTHLSHDFTSVIAGSNRVFVVRLSHIFLLLHDCWRFLQAEQLIGALVSECKSRELGSELTEVRQLSVRFATQIDILTALQHFPMRVYLVAPNFLHSPLGLQAFLTPPMYVVFFLTTKVHTSFGTA